MLAKASQYTLSKHIRLRAFGSAVVEPILLIGKKSARPILHRIKKLEEHKSSCRGEHGVVENCLIEKISSCDSTLCNPYESLGHSARVIIVYNNDTIRLLNFDHSLKTQFDC